MTIRSSALASPLTLCVVRSKPSWLSSSSLASLVVLFLVALASVPVAASSRSSSSGWTMTTKTLGVMTPRENSSLKTESSPMDAYHSEQTMEHAKFGVRPHNRQNPRKRRRRLRAISEPNSSPMDAFHLTFESLPHQQHNHHSHYGSNGGNTLVRRAAKAVQTTKNVAVATATTTFVTATTARSKDTEKEDSATTPQTATTHLSTPTRLTLAQRQRRWRSYISSSSAPPVAADASTSSTLSPMDAFDAGASQRPTIIGSSPTRDAFGSSDASSMMQYHALRHRRLTQVENSGNGIETSPPKSSQSSSQSSQWLLSIHEWAVTTSLTTRIVVLACGALALIGMCITICCCVCDVMACYASRQRRLQRRLEKSSKSKAGATSEGDQTDTEDYGVDLSFDEDEDDYDDLDYTECGFASQDALPPGVDLNLYHRTSRCNNSNGITNGNDDVPIVVVPSGRSRRGILRTSKKPWRTSTSPPSVSSSSVDATVGRGRPDKGSVATEDATVTSVASASTSSAASSSPFIFFSSAHSDDSGSVRADDDECVVVMAAVDSEDTDTNASKKRCGGRGGGGTVASTTGSTTVASPPPSLHCSERVQREAWDEFERQSSSCPSRQSNVAQYINGDDYDDEAVLVHEYRLPLSVQWKRQMSALNLTPGIVQSTGLGDDDNEMDDDHGDSDSDSNNGAKTTVTERELVEI